MQTKEGIRLRNHAIWETAVDAILTIDDGGFIIACNPAAETLFGYNSDEALGQNIALLMPQKYRDQHDEHLKRQLHQPMGGHQVNAIGTTRQLVAQHKNGQTFPVHLSLSEMNVKGQRQFSAIIRDISELKDIENALRDNEQRLRFGQDFAGIGTWDWNVDTDELYWTEQIPPLFGHPKGALETSYENFRAAIHVDDRLLVEDAITTCLEQDIPYNIEHRVVWPDGSVHWLHERGDVVRDGQGKPVRMLGVVSDISEAKQTQIDLHESEARFRDIAENMSDWIWEVDAQGVFTYCSGNIEAILGYRPDEIIGRTPFDLMTTEEAQTISAVFADIAQNKRPINNLENWNLAKDGHRVCLLTNGVPLLDAEGELIGYRGVDKDITDEKHMKAALIEAKEVAERANLAKSEFLSNMSHELRTPLNAILGFAQLFGFDDNLNEDQQLNLTEINRAGEHLLEVINEILDLAKVEAGVLDLKMGATPICDILEECYAISLPLTKEHAIRLHIDTNTDAAVYADRTRLKQVLLNLISNGIKYNHPNGMVEVKVGKGDQAQWRISVNDTGLGITPDNLENLFQPFNRLDLGQSQIEGTGVGLVISKNFVEAMGGSIGVKSIPGKGSHFWVEFPSVRASEPMELIGETDSALAKDEYGCECNQDIAKHSGRILAVEDNTTNQALLQIQLQSLNYKVDIASNGIEALDFLSKESYKLILTDCNMAKMNGFQFAEVVRQQENGQHRHIPILAITANIITGEADRYHRAGMDDCLAKPVSLDILQAKIEKYWAHSVENEPPLFSTSAQNTERQCHLDITVLQNTLGDQPKDYQHVLSIFTQSAPADVKEILQAVTSQDHEALHLAAHKLKSAARAIGARLLAAICQLLEVNSHHTDWDKAAKLTAQLTIAMTQVEAVIADHT